jgi:hypothetical protein
MAPATAVLASVEARLAAVDRISQTVPAGSRIALEDLVASSLADLETIPAPAANSPADLATIPALAASMEVTARMISPTTRLSKWLKA